MVTLRNLTICFVVIFFSHATPSLCRELHFDSTDRYNIRWGKQDGDADLVKCRHGLTVGYSFGPACFKKGSYIIVSLVLDDTPEDKVVVDWHHVENGLYRAIGVDSNGNPVTEETAFMSLPVQEQGQGVGKVFIMGPLPDWIEWCVLKVRVIFVHQGKQGRVGVSALHWCEIFTVLDEPKAPMNPAWVIVLRISCQWARGIATAEAAAKVLTENLYLNGVIINPGAWPNMQFIRNATDDGEIFYLRKFIESGFYGYSSDFADFLVCLVTSVGAYEMKVQRTYSLNVIYTLSATDPDKGGWTILTNLIDPAGALQSANHYEFPYTQFAIVGSDVWDGSLAIVIEGHTNLPIKWARDSKYKPVLVQFFRYYENHTLVLQKFPGEEGEPWNPTPANGFVPQVTAADLPEG
jgi:hypothetical protein